MPRLTNADGKVEMAFSREEAAETIRILAEELASETGETVYLPLGLSESQEYKVVPLLDPETRDYPGKSLLTEDAPKQ